MEYLGYLGWSQTVGVVALRRFSVAVRARWTMAGQQARQTAYSIDRILGHDQRPRQQETGQHVTALKLD